jgi:putative addiction module CopG family antidote
MDISLTPELEFFIAEQLQTGHYKSASEIVREALRNQIRTSMKEKLDFRIELARQQVAEGSVMEANANYFEGKRKMIREKYLDNSPAS